MRSVENYWADGQGATSPADRYRCVPPRNASCAQLGLSSKKNDVLGSAEAAVAAKIEPRTIAVVTMVFMIFFLIQTGFY